MKENRRCKHEFKYGKWIQINDNEIELIRTCKKCGFKIWSRTKK